MTQEYVPFPKWMTHAAHKAAVNSGRHRDPDSGKIVQDPPGQPEKFPNVMVKNKDQEQYYAAMGYTPTGVGDPEAYRRAMTGNESPKPGTFVDYPRMLYRMEGAELKDRTVANEAEENALAGWHRTPDLARNQPKPMSAAQAKKQPIAPPKMSAETRRKISETQRRKAAERKAQVAA